MNQLYFSVESRKGGVGKTTVALNMCKLLLKKGYSVLMLDCDITGTSSAEASANSEFWKGDINVINYTDKSDGKEKPLNLLSLFCKKKSQESDKDDNCEALYLEELDYIKNKINIIGSELYDGNQLIVDPRYLVDEIHSYWVVSMLKELAGSFFKKNPKAAVVVDNSPGYVGLGRLIHEWFTDLGPEKAHFLLVSSIDEQDVKSSIAATIEIKRLMEGKLRVAEYFNQLKSGETIDDKEEEFLKSDNHYDRFFYSLIEHDDYPIGNFPLSMYAAIVFNKVLPECLEEDSDYKFSDVLQKDVEKDILLSLSNSLNIDSTSLMIPYDPLVNTQFFGKHLYFKVIESQDYWIKRFEKLSTNTRKYLSMNDVVKAAFSLNGYLTRLKTSIDIRGSKRLAASIKPEWFPAFCLNELRSIVDRMAYYTRPEEMLKINAINRKDIASYNETALELFIKEKKLSKYSPVLHSFLNHLNVLAGAKLDSRNIQLLITTSLFFTTLLNIHYKEYDKEDYRSFLIKEIGHSYKNDYAQLIGALVPITKDKTIKTEDFNDIMGICFDKFYSAACYALIRLIDLKSDFELLISVLEKLITSVQKNLIPIAVTDFLDRTIVMKKGSQETIDKVFNDAYSMTIFTNVFQNIIFKNWGL